MKLTCRPTLFTGAQKKRMEEDSTLAKLLGYHQLDDTMGACKKWLAVTDPHVERLLDLLEESDTLLTDIRWSKKEIEQARGYHLVCKTVAMSDGDNVAQTSSFSSSRPVLNSSKWNQISIFPYLKLNSVKLKNSTIRYLGQWTEELVCAKDVFQAWPSDWSPRFVRPVENRKNQVRTDLFHFTPIYLMPCVSAETIGHYETRDNGPDQPSTPRFRRALTYPKETLDNMPLMARTAEPFGNLGQGLILVSQDWRQWCLQHKWKGPRFHPLLEWGSPLWEQFEEQWKRLLHLAQPKGLNVF